MAPRQWRILDTGPCDPQTNMALDEALLLGFLRHRSPPTLRLYGWDPAAISIGVSQDAARELDIGACRRSAVPFVRRMTGGGIIVHDRELTYSIACAREDLGARGRVILSYKTIAAFLVAFYRQCGLDAGFACDRDPAARLGAPSAVCFAGREKYDIVVGGRKIGGSAQRRMRDAIFQHGSIPMERCANRAAGCVRSPMASPAVAATLADLLGRCPDRAALAADLVRAFTGTFGVAAKAGLLSREEERLRDLLRKEKYANDAWTIARTDRVAQDTDHADIYDAAFVGQ